MDLVIGGGAVGTALITYLQLAQRDVLLQVKASQLANFSSCSELITTFSNGEPAIVQAAPKICDSIEDWAQIEHLYITVKNTALDELLSSMPKKLPRHITLVPCLNGVRAQEKIRQAYPDARIAPMIVMFNASQTTALKVKFTTKPMILLDHNAVALAQSFSQVGMICAPGSRALAWGKLLINLNNSICSLTRTTFKDVLVDQDLRRIMIATLDESMGVLDKAKIPYRLPFPAPARFYRLGLQYAGPLLWHVAHRLNGVSDDSYPSMMADLAKGRETEIDYLNGEICTLAKEHQIASPINDQLVQKIKQLEQAERGAQLKASELRRELNIS